MLLKEHFTFRITRHSTYNCSAMMVMDQVHCFVLELRWLVSMMMFVSLTLESLDLSSTC